MRKNEGTIILSLFDGCSCGQVALERADIKVRKYYSSEIDKYAIQVTQDKYPKTIQLGNIENWKEWESEQPDIIIGGSPCQGFSFAGKPLNFDDPRSRLFFTFVDILKHYNPKYFLLENVKMAKEHNDIISRILGEMYPECISQPEMFQSPRLEPVLINSALVSAQNRERLYWTNIPDVKQPEDKKIYLKDIIESGESDRDKSLVLTASVGNATEKGYKNRSMHQMVKGDRIIGRPIDNPKSRISGQPTKQILEIRDDEKTNCLSTVEKDNVVVYDRCLQIGEADIKGFDCIKRVYSILGKSPSLTSNSGGNRETKIANDNITYRKLTPLECERLQTFPANYTLVMSKGKKPKQTVSNSQRYKMIGNGWTVEVIAHIFNNIEFR